MAATLEDYALKSLHLAKMTGVMVGVHAISDAFLLMHSGVGCKYKTASQLSLHDWATHPNRREGWTQVGDRQLIQGSAGRIAPFARSWFERRSPGFIAMVTSLFLELTGEDFSEAFAEVSGDLPCPTALLSTGRNTSDLFAGYGALLLEAARALEWHPNEDLTGWVGLVGHWFTRYESDHRADVAQLRSLIKAAGLRPGPILLSGSTFDELRPIGSCPQIVQLPYARPVAPQLDELLGRSLPRLDLPMGIAGTSRWLRELAKAAGGDRRQVEAYLAAGVRRIREQTAKLSERFTGMPVAVFAEAPLAAGLCSMLTEFGLRPMLVGLRDATLGGRAELERCLSADGYGLPDGAVVVERPSIRWIRRELSERVQRQQLQGVLASSTELSTLDERASGQRPFRLEIGFPTNNYHVTTPAPLLGLTGVTSFAQRLLDACLSRQRS